MTRLRAPSAPLRDAWHQRGGGSGSVRLLLLLLLLLSLPFGLPAAGRGGPCEEPEAATAAAGLSRKQLRESETGASAGEERGGQVVAEMALDWLGVALLGLQLCSRTLALEVSVGKAPVIYAKNGTNVLLPCTFNSCIGIEKANFIWSHNQTEIFKGVVKNKDSKPEPYPEYKFNLKHMLPPDLPLSKDNREFNVSLLLLDADFEDSGPYTCLVKNPKEKDANHSGTFTLKVVVMLEKVDNTLTLIILSVAGGVIGLLILIMLTKKLVLFILKKTRKQKECLVSSSAIENTENGLPGSKIDSKSAPKA